MVTTRRNLRTGRSVWEGRRAEKVRHATLVERPRDRRADHRRRHHRGDDRGCPDAGRPRGRRGRPAPRSGQGFDGRLDRAGAIRDRHPAHHADPKDRQGRCHTRLATLEARGRGASRPAARTLGARCRPPRRALSRRRCAGCRRSRARTCGAAGGRIAGSPAVAEGIEGPLRPVAIGRIAGLRQSRDRSAQDRACLARRGCTERRPRGGAGSRSRTCNATAAAPPLSPTMDTRSAAAIS